MKRRAGPGEQLLAALQIQQVIGVAAVRRAAPTGDHLLGAELTEVVGDKALAQLKPRAELPDPPIAVCQLGQQPPAHGMPSELEKARRRPLPARLEG
jgi:hypothetical protein